MCEFSASRFLSYIVTDVFLPCVRVIADERLDSSGPYFVEYFINSSRAYDCTFQELFGAKIFR